MATEILDPHFTLGFQTDVPRDLLPDGVAYRMKDYIPSLESPIRKRGGFTHASAALAAGASVGALGWAPFDGDPHLLITNNLGNAYYLKTFDGDAPTGASGINTHASITERPFWHKSMMILLQGLTASTGVPHKYTAAGGGVYSVANLGGTPPQARAGASWGDYLILANGHDGTSDKRNRVWWSGPGNAESWSVGSGGSFWDMPGEVLKVVSLRNILLFLGYTEMWMLTGDTPPPGGNMAQRDLFNEGCSDPRSVARWRDYIIWANNTGIWRTDGTTITDLTDQGGISLYWQNLVGSQFALTQGWSAVGGVYRDQYFITVLNNAGTHVVTLVCDLNRYVWYEFTNFDVTMYAPRSSGPGTLTVAGSEEMFFGRRDQPRVAKMSPVWTPTSSNTADADLADVLPVIETRFHRLDVSEAKRIKRIYLTYDLRTSGQALVLDASFVLSPGDTAYIPCGTDFQPTTRLDRHRVTVGRATHGIAFKLAQVGPSNDTRIHSLEAEAYARAEQR